MTTLVQPPGASVALNAVVCLDGSDRAADAIAPALELANQRRETVTAVGLCHDEECHARILGQLSEAGLTTDAMTTVATKSEMFELLLDLAHRGATPVLSAFGHRDRADRLGGMLGDLIRADIDRMLAIGPRVANERPATAGCLVVSADGVCSVEPLIEATGTFVTSTTTKIVVVHVVPPSEPSPSFSANRNTAKFTAAFSIPVEAAAVAGLDISKTIAKLARDEGASLILARSWHRFSAQQPPSASSSLSIVAEASCPVLIVN